MFRIYLIQTYPLGNLSNNVKWYIASEKLPDALYIRIYYLYHLNLQKFQHVGDSSQGLIYLRKYEMH